MGKLSIVGTPIGNLEDITLRALRLLKEADVMFCEDTRVTKKLLAHYKIDTPVKRLDAHTEGKVADEVIERIRGGENVALVSDAGMPGISDPGARTARAVREAGLDVEVIPGPSSVTTALSVSGISGDKFIFLGFLPHKKGRQTTLKYISEQKIPVVLFESTHRIVRLLKEFEENFVANRNICIAREMTKIHEEVLCGAPADIRSVLEELPEKQKGEFVVIVEPK